MENELTTLHQLVATQGELLQSYKAQLDKIPAEAGGSGKITKYSEPPTFSGSDNKMTLEDWLNCHIYISLYCSSTGIVTDHQKIVCGLTCLRAPATTYMKWYFDATRRNEDLGSWDKFVKELTAIYGRRDETQGAKDELTALWANKTLASKDFIKYAEQYRTLACIVEYEDKLHVDKLSDVIPQEFRNSLVMIKVTGKLPEKWDDFLELLLETYKALHPEKSKNHIFGNKKGSEPDPNAMQIDQANKNKGKNKEQATIPMQRETSTVISAQAKGTSQKQKHTIQVIAMTSLVMKINDLHQKPQPLHQLHLQLDKETKEDNKHKEVIEEASKHDYLSSYKNLKMTTVQPPLLVAATSTLRASVEVSIPSPLKQ
ncbi:hypothetical protein VKT23_012209 [Stygiomarasmius scandens]|uniref:Retrotransposon gag domain-containing protein n=1 Tax=Marasmiellus scandens TaxID=2682957 RepID=A0ABR1J9M0_9AGAR